AASLPPHRKAELARAGPRNNHQIPSMRFWVSCVSSLSLHLGLSSSQDIPVSGIGTPCTAERSDWVVSTPAEALELSDALLCSGPGQFEVTWSGNVVLTRTIALSDGKSVKIAGAGAGEAVIASGEPHVRLLALNGSTLELDGLSLVGAEATMATVEWDEIIENGAGLLVSGSSRLDVYNCSFVGLQTRAGGGSAIYSTDSDITIFGDTTFASNIALDDYDDGGAIHSEFGNVSISGKTVFFNNSGVYGGALYSLNGRVSIDGDTVFANNSVRYHGGKKR
ncbi:unnamed protein product, partial [Ectocarpus sp. 6 AP-2014]